MIRRATIVLAVSLLSVALGGRAQADVTPEARRAAATHFAEGTRAFAAGDFEQAANEFDAAYELAPHYDVLWNAAQAADRAGSLARAANGYHQYLKLAPPGAADRDHANQELLRLSARLSLMHVRHEGVTDVKLDDTPLLVDEVYVEPGVHVATGRASTGNVSERVTTSGGEAVTVTLAAPASPNPGVLAKVPSDASGTYDAHSEERHGLPPWVFLACAGATAVTGGLAIASGLDTVSAAHDFDTHPTATGLDDGKAKQLRTNVLYAAAGVFGVATAVTGIWLVDWHAHRERAVSLGLGPASARLRVAF